MKESTKQIIFRIASFATPFFILLTIIIQRGIYPFGDRGILASDLYHQYMPFLQELQHKLKSGESLIYSWNLGIGTNFQALYTYYLASPVNWILRLWPTDYVMEYIACIIVVKVSLCGFTAKLYFETKDKNQPAYSYLFSLFYAFSGFMCAYYYNIMWLDVILLAPLVVLGLEQLILKGKWQTYTICLGISILSNFYISMMLCMFLVLYAVVLFFTEGLPWKRVPLFAICSLAAGGLAAILLVPEVIVLSGTDFAGNSLPEKFRYYFSVLDVLARQCAFVTTEKGLNHWPNVYCGVAVLLLVPMYVFQSKIPAKKRFAKTALVGFFLASFCIGNLEFVWHGMNYPDSLPGRESYVYILLLLGMALEGLTEIKGLTKKHIIAVSAAAIAYLLLMQKLGVSDHFKEYTFFVNCVLIALYGCLLYGVWMEPAGLKKQLLFGAAVILCVGEVTANLASTSITTIDRTSYLSKIDDHQRLYEKIQSTDGSGFFRTEKFNRKTKNDGALYQIPTATCFSSTQNSQVMHFYKALGMRYSKGFYEYGGATPLISSLLNVDYTFDETKKADKGTRENELYTKVDETLMVELYKNRYTLPFGYTLPTGFDLNLEAGFGLAVQNEMVSDLLGTTKRIFEPIYERLQGKSATLYVGQDGYYFGVMNNGKVKKMTMTGAAMSEYTFKDLKQSVTVELGHLNAGDEVVFKNADDGSDAELSMDVYQLDLELLEQVLAKMAQVHMTDVVRLDNGVKGRISLQEPARVVLSVAIEKGMQVLVNGEEVTPKTFGGALLALDLEPGEMEIEVSYHVPGLWLGVTISAMVLALVAFFAFYGIFREKLLARKAQMMQNDNEKVNACEGEEG